MAGIIDIAQQEKEITAQAVKKLRAAVRQEVSRTSQAKTGDALRISNAGSRFKNGRLQRLTIKAPFYTFMQNYGFEGRKSNGVNQRLQATNVIAKAIENADVLEDLATEISELRLDQITAVIQFNNNGR